MAMPAKTKPRSVAAGAFGKAGKGMRGKGAPHRPRRRRDPRAGANGLLRERLAASAVAATTPPVNRGETHLQPSQHARAATAASPQIAKGRQDRQRAKADELHGEVGSHRTGISEPVAYGPRPPRD